MLGNKTWYKGESETNFYTTITPTQIYNEGTLRLGNEDSKSLVVAGNNIILFNDKNSSMSLEAENIIFKDNNLEWSERNYLAILDNWGNMTIRANELTFTGNNFRTNYPDENFRAMLLYNWVNFTIELKGINKYTANCNNPLFTQSNYSQNLMATILQQKDILPFIKQRFTF